MPAKHAVAAVHNLHMEWSYEDDADNPAQSFNLYCNDVLAKSGIESDYRILNFILDANEGILKFTLAAVLSNNNESPHSAPYFFTADSPIAPSVPKGFTIGALDEYKKSILHFTRTIVTTDIKTLRLNEDGSDINTLVFYSLKKESVFTKSSLTITHYKLQPLLMTPVFHVSKSLKTSMPTKILAILPKKYSIIHV